ncbi:helix-turn-helix transcriptional regulator [Salinarimonas ramus]|uniref:helix-turn-helix transcriptional regulator n=1 Tax=Salinarimonas ramus TaxID=690164 RepID=UPI00166670C8|nr:LuxR family transcriptional regulator [Salinarimonas ramus]
MRNNPLDRTLADVAAIDRARTEAELRDALIGVARRWGFERVLAGTLPAPGASRTEQIENVLVSDWPEGWVRRYFGRGYLFTDPAIRRVREQSRPFLWSELTPLCVQDWAAQRVMDEAGDFGLRHGLTVPLTTLDGRLAGVSFAGAQVEVAPETRGTLALLATYSVAHSQKLRNAQASAPVLDAEVEEVVRLSPRELEALQWAAEGRTEDEIGDLMTISTHGVEKHMRAARRKLGARNRTHAVAEAIRRGIIR